MTLLDDSVVSYLKEMNVMFINPVWNKFDGVDKFVIGYYFDAYTIGKLMEVRKDLERLLEIDNINYSLSVYNHTQSTKFIIYMNNKEEIKGKTK